MGNGGFGDGEYFVTRELAPAGPRSGPNPSTAFVQVLHSEVFWGCYAAQREQAPSPRVGYSLENLG